MLFSLAFASPVAEYFSGIYLLKEKSSAAQLQIWPGPSVVSCGWNRSANFRGQWGWEACPIAVRGRGFLITEGSFMSAVEKWGEEAIM